MIWRNPRKNLTNCYKKWTSSKYFKLRVGMNLPASQNDSYLKDLGLPSGKNTHGAGVHNSIPNRDVLLDHGFEELVIWCNTYGQSPLAIGIDHLSIGNFCIAFHSYVKNHGRANQDALGLQHIKMLVQLIQVMKSLHSETQHSTDGFS